jgi:hypothetical protein
MVGLTIAFVTCFFCRKFSRRFRVDTSTAFATVDAQVAQREQQRLLNLPTFVLNIRLANEFLKGAEYVETQSFLQTRQAIDFIHSSGTPLPTLKLSDTISTALRQLQSLPSSTPFMHLYLLQTQLAEKVSILLRKAIFRCMSSLESITPQDKRLFEAKASTDEHFWVVHDESKEPCIPKKSDGTKIAHLYGPPDRPQGQNDHTLEESEIDAIVVSNEVNSSTIIAFAESLIDFISSKAFQASIQEKKVLKNVCEEVCSYMYRLHGLLKEAGASIETLLLQHQGQIVPVPDEDVWIECGQNWAFDQRVFDLLEVILKFSVRSEQLHNAQDLLFMSSGGDAKFLTNAFNLFGTKFADTLTARLSVCQTILQSHQDFQDPFFSQPLRFFMNFIFLNIPIAFV